MPTLFARQILQADLPTRHANSGCLPMAAAHLPAADVEAGRRPTQARASADRAAQPADRPRRGPESAPATRDGAGCADVPDGGTPGADLRHARAECGWEGPGRAACAEAGRTGDAAGEGHGQPDVSALRPACRLVLRDCVTGARSVIDGSGTASSRCTSLGTCIWAGLHLCSDV